MVAAIGAVAAVAGGAIASDGARSAANTQADAAAQADETQRYIFDTNRADQAGYQRNGNAANQKLADLLGIGGGSSAGGAGSSSAGLTRDQLRAQLLPQYTTQSSTPGGAALFASDPQERESGPSGVYANPSQTTQSIDENGLNSAIDSRLAQQSQQQAQQQATAQNDPSYGSLLKNFSTNDFYNDPVTQISQQFLQDQGQQAINHQASASGSSLSGATLKALQKYNSGLISQQAGDSYNRFNTNKQNTFNMLSGVSGTGQVANSQVAASNMNYGNQVSNNQTALGSARGASAIAQGNALAGGLTGAYNNYQNAGLYNSLTNRLNGSSSSGGNWTGYDMPTANSFSNGDYSGY